MKPQTHGSSNTAPASPTPTANAPLKTIRMGRIKAVIWENEADQRKVYNVTFSRTYMDEKKQFHNTDSFGKDDLLLLAKLADEAHTCIFARRAELKNED